MIRNFKKMPLVAFIAVAFIAMGCGQKDDPSSPINTPPPYTPIKQYTLNDSASGEKLYGRNPEWKKTYPLNKDANFIRDAKKNMLWIDMAPNMHKTINGHTYLCPRVHFDDLSEVRKKFNNTSKIALLEYSPYDTLPEEVKVYYTNKANNSISSSDFNRALGAFAGNCVGDFVGALLEFLSVNDDTSSIFYNSSGNDYSIEKSYTKKKNRFSLKPGQWTDDFSMARCMADSLIFADGKPKDNYGSDSYNGSDLRARFWCWWNRGYNNAFRYDEKSSVGLGGNIGESLDVINDMNDTQKIQHKYINLHNSTDAGNGSIMRLSPVVVRFCHNEKKCMEVAAEQSYSTHTGKVAADCARFMAFIMCRAINRLAENKTMKLFLDEVVEEFINQVKNDEIKNVAPEVMQLANCQEGDPVQKKELAWNWKAEKPQYVQTITNRINFGKDKNGQSTYNNYPISSPETNNYFGSYAPDGLAMALNACYHTNSFEEALSRCVNYCGDADTTGAIACQVAGAFYGYSTIPKKYINAKNQHDRVNSDVTHHTTEISAGILFEMSKRDAQNS